MTNYDSKAEATFAASPVLQAHEYVKTDEIHNTGCKDKEGTSFCWKGDFITAKYTYLPMLEYKCGALNSRKTKRTADEQFAYRKGKFDQQANIAENSWSNSANKQSIVQHSLPDGTHIIVFETTPTEKEMKLYKKLDLLWTTKKQLPIVLSTYHLLASGFVREFL